MNFGLENDLIPEELSKYFSISHFSMYPLIGIPQIFEDERGVISNIADGKLGDVAVITSGKGSIRANHVHTEDWHLSYLISGKMIYRWVDTVGKFHDLTINKGQLFFTPPGVPHQMEFKDDSCFIAISKLSRTKNNYEADTTRLSTNYFYE